MVDKLAEIKKRVAGGSPLEPPAPSRVEGMHPSIIKKKQEKIEAPAQEPLSVPQAPQAPSMVSPGPPESALQQPVAQPAAAVNVERFQELAESIIDEKWDELVSSVGNITLWKEKIQTDVISIKQELMRVEDRFENLQKAILGRVEEYHRTISDVGSDVKALEQVFEKILQPLTTNIKQLSRITDDLKKKKPKKK